MDYAEVDRAVARTGRYFFDVDVAPTDTPGSDTPGSDGVADAAGEVTG